MKNLSFLTCVLLLGVWLTIPQAVWGYAAGPPDNRCGNPPTYATCATCHNTYPLNSGTGNVTLSGVPPSYVSGHSYPLTITLTDPTLIRWRWGFEITAADPAGGDAGEFVITDPLNTQLSDNPIPQLDFVKQTATGSYAQVPSPVSWTFTWTAPNDDAGATFWFVGNAGNNNNNQFYDYIYLDTLMVSATYPVYVVLTPT
ncbi:MAG: choice-of-anchor V domain-containing protein, partial [bacterium]